MTRLITLGPIGLSWLKPATDSLAPVPPWDLGVASLGIIGLLLTRVVDANFKVYLDRASVKRFTAMSESMRSDDNALDIRSAMPGKKVIQIELAF